MGWALPCGALHPSSREVLRRPLGCRTSGNPASYPKCATDVPPSFCRKDAVNSLISWPRPWLGSRSLGCSLQPVSAFMWRGEGQHLLAEACLSRPSWQEGDRVMQLLVLIRWCSLRPLTWLAKCQKCVKLQPATYLRLVSAGNQAMPLIVVSQHRSRCRSRPED